jgi:hypothetical protein
MRRLITCGLAALTLSLGLGSASATTLYRWVDAQGVVHYSDTPQPGAERIQVQSAQTYKAPAPPPNPQTPRPSTRTDQSSGTSQCAIVSPTAEQSFFAPQSVPVTVSVVPELAPGASVQISLDGSPLPGAGGTQAQIDAPERGVHTVSATVRAADGTVICIASPVSINIQRPSLLSPQSPAHH